MYFLLVVFYLELFGHVIEFGADREGLEGPAARHIELVEELQALQTQVVDVAAQQVQPEVQRVADQADRDEDQQGARHRAQRVEDLGNDAAGQHQGHQTGVGQNVAEPARDVAVDAGEDGGQLASICTSFSK